jgi:hypothetical protein
MKKQTILISAILFSMLLSMSFALGAITFITPTTGSSISGTYVFNVTTAIRNATSCNFSTTANSNFLRVINNSWSDTVFNASYNTALLTETASTTLTANCTNLTGASEVATVTIAIDNTAPTCAFTISEDHLTRQSGMGVTPVQGSSDTTTLTYLWNLTNQEGVQKATYTTSEPTFSNGDFEDIGEYTINLTVTDLVSKSSYCNNKILIKGSNDDVSTNLVNNQVSYKKPSNTYLYLFIILGTFLLMMVGAIAFILTSKAKK